MLLSTDFKPSKTTLETDKDATLFYHRLIEVFKHIYYYRSLLGDENIEKVDDVSYYSLGFKSINIDYKKHTNLSYFYKQMILTILEKGI